MCYIGTSKEKAGTRSMYYYLSLTAGRLANASRRTEKFNAIAMFAFSVRNTPKKHKIPEGENLPPGGQAPDHHRHIPSTP